MPHWQELKNLKGGAKALGSLTFFIVFGALDLARLGGQSDRRMTQDIKLLNKLTSLQVSGRFGSS
jgi:hypothetical protein